MARMGKFEIEEDTKEKKNNVQKQTQRNVQVNMSVKKYCAFGCPVYTVYSTQS